jgi:hypothetical protein
MTPCSLLNLEVTSILLCAHPTSWARQKTLAGRFWSLKTLGLKSMSMTCLDLWPWETSLILSFLVVCHSSSHLQHWDGRKDQILWLMENSRHTQSDRWCGTGDSRFYHLHSIHVHSGLGERICPWLPWHWQVLSPVSTLWISEWVKECSHLCGSSLTPGPHLPISGHGFSSQTAPAAWPQSLAQLQVTLPSSGPGSQYLCLVPALLHLGLGPLLIVIV